VITTAVEHKAVLESCRFLETHHGFRLSVVPVDGDGVLDLDAFAAALTPETTLVSVMLANNEVGTLEPVVEVAALCRDMGVAIHTDAVQAPGQLPLDVEHLGVDLLSISAHKFYGPKGVGALYARRGLPLVPLVDGGGQERGRRSGTENVAGAVGLSVALAIAEEERAVAAPRLTALRDRLIEGVLDRVPGAILTGHRTARLPNHASFCFEGVGGETVLLELEMAGVCCSSGSSCAAGSTDPSHVLTAMGLRAEVALTAVRLTLGTENTDAEVDQVLDLIPAAVQRVRALSST
jgi:cysteine desulfurase